jgi:Asp-tRNA(Asn)/Glu-tRNA(Gln) amidotransferase A subunit family amidase
VYASEDSPRVIETVRNAARGLTSLGATVEATTESWEDWSPQQLVTGAAFAPPLPGSPRPSADAFQAAFEVRGRNYDRFRTVFRDHDLLVSPTAQRVARTVEEWNAAWTTDGAKYHQGNFAPTYTSHTAMFNWLRFPAVSVPCGFVDGLPVGLQIVGLPGSEQQIFRLAFAFQNAFPRDERPPIA